MKWMLVFLLSPLAACAAVERAVSYAYDQYSAGLMDLEGVGEFVLNTEGSERAAREQIVAAGMSVGDWLLSLGLAAGVGGPTGVGLVRMIRRSSLKSGSGAADGTPPT